MPTPSAVWPCRSPQKRLGRGVLPLTSIGLLTAESEPSSATAATASEHLALFSVFDPVTDRRSQIDAVEGLVEAGTALVLLHHEPGEAVEVPEDLRVRFDSGPLERGVGFHGIGRAPLDGDHLPDGRIVPVEIDHALPEEDGLLLPRRGARLLSREHLHVVERARSERGSLDFDLAEPELILDPEGRVVAIQPAARNRAHRLIEELMVAANRCAAKILMGAGQPALYRVHDEPEATRVEDLKRVVGDLGLQLKGDPRSLEPAALQALLESADGRPEERLIDMLVLRTLARALYTPEPRGHYALTTDEYLHFTSPIRRYPDLVVHRMLRRLQAEGPMSAGEEREAMEAELEKLGESCSAAERRAESAEREAVEWKTVLFLREREGEVFAGHISGVTDFGLFVRLDEISVDGMVHISELKNERVGKVTDVLNEGDKVRVKVLDIDNRGRIRLSRKAALEEGEE